jgi:uncharacterized protein YecE (DUF72 family)
MDTREELEAGWDDAQLDRWSERARGWAARGDVFLYVISGAKVRNPTAAKALIERLA